MTRFLAICCLLLGAMLLAPHAAHSAPEVNFFFPAGGQRGSTVEVTVSGKFPQWPLHIWADKPGVDVTPGQKQGELTVTIADDASPGIHWLRLYDDAGAAAPKPFVVATVPETLETEPNDSPEAAQRLDREDAPLTAVIVNGQLIKGGDVDVFSLGVPGGRTLIADLNARAELDSPVDAVLQIVSPEGFVYAQNDDQIGLDPRLAVEIPRDGLWQVRVFGFPADPNSTIGLAGGSTYLYRLTVSAGPCVDYVMPMAASRDAPTMFKLNGWNLPRELEQLTFSPPGADELVLEHPKLCNAVRLPVVPFAIAVESEPNSLEQPQTVDLPQSITGQIDAAGDRDVFAFAVKKDEPVSVRIESRALGFALDPVLELLDSDGKRLAQVDDVGGSRDAELEHKAAADGILRLIVSDLHRDGGPRFVYRLTLDRALPDFKLTVGTHEVVVAAGSKIELPVSIERLQGYSEPIAISIEGLPEGVTAAEATSNGGADSAKKVTLELNASPQASATAGPVRVLGKVGDTLLHEAQISVPGPPSRLVDLWLTVTPPAK